MSTEPKWLNTYNSDVEFADLLGATLVSVTGATPGSDEIVFTSDDGREWRMYHQRDCCESVSVEDVTGDVSDLIGSSLTMAEEVSNAETPEGHTWPYEPESFTWTFYKLATVKGYVTLRWLGESNGYYSESVTVARTKPVRQGFRA